MLKLPYMRHPLFERELRRARLSTQTPDQIKTHSRTVMLLMILIPCLIWFVILGQVPTCRTPAQCRQFNPGYSFYGWQVVNSLLVITFAATLLLDLGSIALTVSSLDIQEKPINWDLLRLTLLRPSSIVAAKHAAAQVRAWNLTMGIVGLRIACALLIVIQNLLPVFAFNSARFRAGFLLPLPALLLIVLMFIVEPLWRMPALTALGLWISARVGSAALTALAGLLGILLVWLTQGVVYLCAVQIMNQLLFRGGLLFNVPGPWGLLFGMLVLVVFAMVLTFAAHVYYTRLQAWSLRRAERLLADDV